jgi:hypothetical protein
VDDGWVLVRALGESRGGRWSSLVGDSFHLYKATFCSFSLSTFFRSSTGILIIFHRSQQVTFFTPACPFVKFSAETVGE